jgi:diketogulonate reductase-like aldo/keto reductase
LLPQKELADYCLSRRIAVEAYSPLMRGQRLQDVVVSEIAGKHGKSTAQVLIRWSLQLGYIVIPRASDPRHIRENLQVFDFELSSDDMQTLSSLPETLRTGLDPATVP